MLAYLTLAVIQDEVSKSGAFHPDVKYLVVFDPTLELEVSPKSVK